MHPLFLETLNPFFSRDSAFVNLLRPNHAQILEKYFQDVRMEQGYIRVYDAYDAAEIVDVLMQKGHVVSEIKKNKIGLEEYYVELMSQKEEM